jgi:hypothetical protein
MVCMSSFRSGCVLGIFQRTWASFSALGACALPLSCIAVVEQFTPCIQIHRALPQITQQAPRIQCVHM